VKQKTILFFLFFILLGHYSFSQGGNVLLLKDKGTTIKTFTNGSYINFQFSNYQWITGYITAINKDSIQIKQFALQPSMSGYGTLGEDTLQLGRFTFNLNEIKAFAKDRGHFRSVFTNGLFLKSAGAFYVVLNVANSLIRKEAVFDNNNAPKLAGGVVAWFVGKIQEKANPDYRPIGKRFSVEIL
jgi:hypothetical protein